MPRRNRNRNTMAAVTPKCKFMTTKPGLEDVQFTHGNSKAAAEFGIARKKLAKHICIKYKGGVGSKAMEEMVHH